MTRRRRRFPPRRLQRAVWPAKRPSWRARGRAAIAQVAAACSARNEELVLALDPCARICCCSSPGRHLRRRRLPWPDVPSGWTLLDAAAVRLGILDRRPRWRSAGRLRAARTILLIVLGIWAQLVVAAVLSPAAARLVESGGSP